MQTYAPSKFDLKEDPLELQYNVSTKQASDGDFHTYIKLSTFRIKTGELVRFSSYALNITRVGNDSAATDSEQPLVKDYFQGQNGTLVLDLVHGNGPIKMIGNQEPMVGAWTADPGRAVIIKGVPFGGNVTYEMNLALFGLDNPQNILDYKDVPYARISFVPTEQGNTSGQVMLNSTSSNISDLWYLGKGVKEGLYLTYRFQDNDTNDGRPYDMTIYFKEYNETGKYWVAPLYINLLNGKTVNETLYLGDKYMNSLEISNYANDNGTLTTTISPSVALGPDLYKDIYISTLDRLAGYVPKPGKPVYDRTGWNVGGIDSSPDFFFVSLQNVTVPAGTFKTALRTAFGENPKMWVNADVPFPVKGEDVYYSSIQHDNSGRLYLLSKTRTFELLEMGTGLPRSVPELPISIFVLAASMVVILALGGLWAKGRSFTWGSK